ncbi:MAG: glycosyltransferase family A protein [Propionibacteriaceae bacterium]
MARSGGPVSGAPRDNLRFSVVIPAYNESGYLAEALSSLHRQTYRGGYEVIVVDNNSTDATAAIARQHGAQVLHELRPGVCAARQRGTEASRGQIVVSTDADTVHPADWLDRLDAQFRRHPEAIAVAGPCRYREPLWWAALFPRLWFTAVAVVFALTDRIFYLTATNVAFVRTAFPGYDLTLTQGGDEVDFLRRLRDRGRVVWDARNPVLTSSRRMDQGLGYTLFVSFGYHYAGSYLLNRLSSRTVVGVMPAIRLQDQDRVRRRRLRWRAGLGVVAAGLAAVAWSRPHGVKHR